MLQLSQLPPAGTLSLAVATGLATFFAPCAYPLLPGYVGYYLTQEEATLRGALLRGVAATVGALVVLGAVGGAVLVAGRPLAERLALFEPVVGLLLFAVGVAVLLGRAPTLHLRLPARRRSVAGFALFGGVYAAAAAGCVVPLVLGVLSRAAVLPAAAGVATLAVYAVSAAAPLLGVTLLAASGSDVLRDLSGHVGSVQRLAGGVMALAGLWQVVIALRFLGVVALPATGGV
ncbi:cytochrome c biogenesis CcdA family protein [Halobium salinum]|uniref:Cytochrome c biogenesis CcdA family protein n=1 Tax=Halobium salinum TaxID=1364940 RepID=A0ABD5P789_9EURY|nr:cytochrome c biogenesis protein CcdA [Halobium salinum]